MEKNGSISSPQGMSTHKIVGIAVALTGISGFLLWLVLYGFAGKGGLFEVNNLPFTIFRLGGFLIIFISGIFIFFQKKIGIVLAIIGAVFYAIFEVLSRTPQ